MSISLLSLGFLLGMRHALESDHVAAVASLATRSRSMGDTLRQGAVWGAGHTLTLFIFGSLVLLLDTVIPETLARVLEFMVGLMLIGLGIDVLRRQLSERIHFHVHRHADGRCIFTRIRTPTSRFTGLSTIIITGAGFRYARVC